MARVLLVTDTPLFRADGRMAGLEVRVFEMARALAGHGHQVTVLEPDGAETPAASLPFVRTAECPSAAAVDVWIAHPRVVRGYLSRLATVPLAVDGYESPFGSFFAHAAALRPTIGPRAAYDYRRTVATSAAALASADAVLCATPAQHASYLTMLAMLGRVRPGDPTSATVLTVCSGASPEPPPRCRPVTTRPTILWAGGCYPWFDVRTFVTALAQVVRRFPAAQCVIAGAGGVNGVGDATELANAHWVRETIATDPVLAARTQFVDWQPYATRGDLYGAADLGVCTSADPIEATFAMRTRIVDMLWGGVPLVVSSGDALGELVAAHGAGLAVPPHDAERLADALVTLASDATRRQHMATAARGLAAGALSWHAQVASLSAWCEASAARGGDRRATPSRALAAVRINAGWTRAVGDLAARALWRLQRGTAP